MAENLRVSMVQSHIIWEDRNENLGYYGELLRRISGKTDLAVLPETFSTGFTMNVEPLADEVDGNGKYNQKVGCRLQNGSCW